MRYLCAGVLPPPDLEGFARFRRWRVESEYAFSSHDPLLHKGLEDRLLCRFFGHLIGDVAWDDNYAIHVGDHHVARIDRHITTADRHIEIDGMMANEIGRGRGAAMECREGKLGDVG